MNTAISILFNTRHTFQKLNKELIDDLNIRTSMIFCICGLAKGIRSVLVNFNSFIEPKFWSTVLLLAASCIVSLVIGRYVVSKILFKMSSLLKGEADMLSIIVVTAYSSIPLLIELPIDFYKTILVKGDLTNSDVVILNVLHIIGWGLSIKILIQGLKTFNGYGTMKALITISPIVALPLLPFGIFWLIRVI